MMSKDVLHASRVSASVRLVEHRDDPPPSPHNRKPGPNPILVDR